MLQDATPTAFLSWLMQRAAAATAPDPTNYDRLVQGAQDARTSRIASDVARPFSTPQLSLPSQSTSTPAEAMAHIATSMFGPSGAAPVPRSPAAAHSPEVFAVPAPSPAQPATTFGGVSVPAVTLPTMTGGSFGQAQLTQPITPLDPMSLVYPTNTAAPFPAPPTTIMAPPGSDPAVSPAPVAPVTTTTIDPAQGYAPRPTDPMAGRLPTAPSRPVLEASASGASGAPAYPTPQLNLTPQRSASASIPTQQPAPPALPASPTHRAAATQPVSDADQLNQLFLAALQSGNRAPFSNEIEARRRRHASK